MPALGLDPHPETARGEVVWADVHTKLYCKTSAVSNCEGGERFESGVMDRRNSGGAARRARLDPLCAWPEREMKQGAILATLQIVGARGVLLWALGFHSGGDILWKGVWRNFTGQIT